MKDTALSHRQQEVRLSIADGVHPMEDQSLGAVVKALSGSKAARSLATAGRLQRVVGSKSTQYSALLPARKPLPHNMGFSSFPFHVSKGISSSAE